MRSSSLPGLPWRSSSSSVIFGLVAVSSLAVTLGLGGGCGGSTSSSNGNGNGNGSDGGGVAEDGGTIGDAFNPSAPVLGHTGIGPIELAPTEEKTVCILKKLDTTEDILATRVVVDLVPGSHHLIVYRWNGTAENLTPFPCTPFNTLISSGASPVVMAGKAHTDYGFPAGVGVELKAGQLLRIEAHYINAGNTPLQGSATVSFEGVRASEAGNYQKANFAFWGTTQINIPAQGTFSTGVKFQVGAAGMKVFGVTTHQHQLGTGVKVWASSAPGDTSNQLLDEKSWGNPELKTLDPALTFDGQNGFSYQCDWKNPTSQPVQFGESATQEMCFVGSYYYPSHGFDACVDGRCQGR